MLCFRRNAQGESPSLSTIKLCGVHLTIGAVPSEAHWGQDESYKSTEGLEVNFTLWLASSQGLKTRPQATVKLQCMLVTQEAEDPSPSESYVFFLFWVRWVIVRIKRSKKRKEGGKGEERNKGGRE